MSFTKFLKCLEEGTLRQEIIGRDEWDDILIDTCYTGDTERYETLVVKGEEGHVVEEYETKELAIKGHKKWIKRMKENPNRKIKSATTAVEWFLGTKLK